MTRTHRAPFTGSPVPCCGRTLTELDPEDIITGEGPVTCLGVIPLPPTPTGDVRELVALTAQPRAGGRYAASAAP